MLPFVTCCFVLISSASSATANDHDAVMECSSSNNCDGKEMRSDDASDDENVDPMSFLQTMGERKRRRCRNYDMGTPEFSLDGVGVLGKEKYYEELKTLNISALFHSIANVMTDSKRCWPADGPQDGDLSSYAGLFERMAWHCAGTFRSAKHGKLGAAGGCEGGRQRFWPENEWHDNSNLDKARALLSKVKKEFGDALSWGDLITFAGTVAIKASGGPAKKFCFGRVDDSDGQKSIQLQREGVNSCSGSECTSDSCKTYFRWPEQDESDHPRCNFTQSDGREQASHAIGLIYVFPEGPTLKNPPSDPTWVHNRSPTLSALEVRDTFNIRMGWTDRETVALIAGGHTLGRAHGNCDLKGTQYESYAGTGPYFEAVEGTGRGPTNGICGRGGTAGLGKFTVTSGFEGPWTRTPSRWNYDYLESTLNEAWQPQVSPYGNDQWWTVDRESKNANTMRLTSDMALAVDPIYRSIAEEYAKDSVKFDSDFADAWYKLVHRSADHPDADDLEKDADTCTHFEFL